MRLVGIIASAGFASGDRFVVGHWLRSPLGSVDDLMWARPDGERRLVAPSSEIADFVASVYSFDSVVVADLEVAAGDASLELRAAYLDVDLELRLAGGRRRPIPLPSPERRPSWVTRYLEAPIARRLLGVEAYGITATGVREWYQASSYRAVTSGYAALGGVDLGPMQPSIDPPVRFGFSEPPHRPSIVEVSPLLALTEAGPARPGRGAG